MKSLTLNLIIFCLLLQTALTKMAERKWYKTSKNKLYYIEENYQYNWYEAFLQCSMRQLSLATLETEEEFEDLAEILKEGNFAFNAPHLWIGALGYDRQFAWVLNNQPVFTNNWLPGNPDNTNKKEHCLHFWENTTKINDRNCEVKSGFICENNNDSKDQEKNNLKHQNIVVNVVNKA